MEVESGLKAGYEHFVPEFERLVRQHGKLRVLFEMTGFHGWEIGALWEDIKFDIKHFADIERLATVGEKKWQRGMATFCKPFTKATIRYFDHANAADAYRDRLDGLQVHPETGQRDVPYLGRSRAESNMGLAAESNADHFVMA